LSGPHKRHTAPLQAVTPPRRHNRGPYPRGADPRISERDIAPEEVLEMGLRGGRIA